MIPTEISMLDKAERGDSHGDLGEDAPRQIDGRESHRTSESMAQPQASVVQVQTEGLGE